MAERTLIERLREPHRFGERRAADRAGESKASVLGHLRRMLNTRQNNAPAVPDYGVPDLVDMVRNFPESTGQMEQAIRTSIQRYEPRLSAVQVRYVPREDEGLTLSFEISARLGQDGRGVSFVTRITPDGPVEVSD